MNPNRNLVKLRRVVVKKALNGLEVTQLAREYMVSRKFIYKWKKRYGENPEGAWYKDRFSRPKKIKRKVTEESKRRILSPCFFYSSFFFKDRSTVRFSFCISSYKSLIIDLITSVLLSNIYFFFIAKNLSTYSCSYKSVRMVNNGFLLYSFSLIE